ncbi:hypothetical protein ACQYAD_10675 [Neobacillus sp. SM06]|uniref:hypothetical protein n=1 Tax=Neobacillus sp. SM06 TaxID=3422492 RepID=UPI003D2E14EF
MNIDRYYRNAAKINLNGSLAALIPALAIVIGNILIFKQNELMLLAIPFVIYSILLFQLYLRWYKQSIAVHRELLKTKKRDCSFDETDHFLIFFQNTQRPRLFLFFPNGSLAGTIQAERGRKYGLFGSEQLYTILDAKNEKLGFYQISKNHLVIHVYDEEEKYIGSFEKKVERNQLKKEVVDSTGRVVGTVEGSQIFMDEHLLNMRNDSIGRLRRGWMPLEWADLFPDPNTPVFTLSNRMSMNEKLLQFTILVNEYFIQRH